MPWKPSLSQQFEAQITASVPSSSRSTHGRPLRSHRSRQNGAINGRDQNGEVTKHPEYSRQTRCNTCNMHIGYAAHVTQDLRGGGRVSDLEGGNRLHWHAKKHTASVGRATRWNPPSFRWYDSMTSGDPNSDECAMELTGRRRRLHLSGLSNMGLLLSRWVGRGKGGRWDRKWSTRQRQWNNHERPAFRNGVRQGRGTRLAANEAPPTNPPRAGRQEGQSCCTATGAHCTALHLHASLPPQSSSILCRK